MLFESEVITVWYVSEYQINVDLSTDSVGIFQVDARMVCPSNTTAF